jgi:hypothetical protein
MAISDTQLTVLSLICLLFFSTARPNFSQIPQDFKWAAIGLALLFSLLHGHL